MSGIECWITSFYDKKVIAKVMLPAVPPAGGKVSFLQKGEPKKTFAVFDVEYEAPDFSFLDAGTKGEVGHVLLFVEP